MRSELHYFLHSRVKKLDEYHCWRSVRTKQSVFTNDMFVELQPSYDVKAKDTEAADFRPVFPATFRGGSDGKTLKYLAGFSEMAYLLTKSGDLSKSAVEMVRNRLAVFPEDKLFANLPNVAAARHDMASDKVGDARFSVQEEVVRVYRTPVADSPLFAEIVLRPYQRGVGTQPMLYLYVPIEALDEGQELIGRAAERNECAALTFNGENGGIVLEVLFLLGILSSSHKRDVLKIFEIILQA